MNEIRRKDIRIDRTEMPLYPANLLFKHFVPKARFEFTLSQGCGCDTHCFLTTTKKDLLQCVG